VVFPTPPFPEKKKNLLFNIRYSFIIL
jgi:hypothetical protein